MSELKVFDYLDEYAKESGVKTRTRDIMQSGKP